MIADEPWRQRACAVWQTLECACAQALLLHNHLSVKTYFEAL